MNGSAPGPPRISLIMPTLDERDEIEPTVRAAEAAALRAPFAVQLIAVDGGSRDGTVQWLESRPGWRVLRSGRGRAAQMNAGAAIALSPWLMFLHADTHLKEDQFAGADSPFGESANEALAFELEFRSDRPVYRRMERGVNWRSRRFGLPYGDQAMCVPRSWFEALGGFRGAPFLEDLDLVLRLYSLGKRFRILGPAVGTSPRQWRKQGVVPGILLNLGRLAGALAVHFAGGEHFRLRREPGLYSVRQEVIDPS